MINEPEMLEYKSIINNQKQLTDMKFCPYCGSDTMYLYSGDWLSYTVCLECEDQLEIETRVDELGELDKQIMQKDRMIQHLSNRLDKSTNQLDKIRGLAREYDCGELSAELLVSYLKMYVRYNGN